MTTRGVEMSDMSEQNSGRGRYITLAILLAWVVGVFIFTLLKYRGS